MMEEEKVKRKVLASLLLIAVVAGLVSAGTFAWWSDTENSNANVFATGSMNMTITDNNEGPLDGTPVTASWTSPAGWYPGQEFSGWIRLVNTGSTPILFLEIDWQRPTPGAGTDEADTNALTNKIIVTQLDELIGGLWYNNIDPAPVGDPFQLKIKDFDGDQNRLTLYELVRSYKFASEPYGDCTGKRVDAWGMCVDHVADSLSGGGYDAAPGLAIPVGGTYELHMTFKLSGETPDALQNKIVNMNITFRGIQDISQRN